jgi:hypothetical protein
MSLAWHGFQEVQAINLMQAWICVDAWLMTGTQGQKISRRVFSRDKAYAVAFFLTILFL